MLSVANRKGILNATNYAFFEFRIQKLLGLKVILVGYVNPTWNLMLKWQTYSPPTHIGAGPPVNGEYQHWLQPVALIG